MGRRMALGAGIPRLRRFGRRTLGRRMARTGGRGSLGTILTGIFALDGGLLYGGGLHMLGVQLLGAVVYAAWAILCGLILFYVLRRTIGLRVDRRVEEDGLDYYEHGETSYNI